MSGDTNKQIQEKLERARRLLEQASDQTTIEGLRIHVEELEAQLLLAMSKGPQA
jgi:hypothetical protein